MADSECTYRFFLLVNTSFGLGDGPLQTHRLIEIGDVDGTVDMEQLLVVDLSIPEPCSNVLHLRLCGCELSLGLRGKWGVLGNKEPSLFPAADPSQQKKKFETKKGKYRLRAVMGRWERGKRGRVKKSWESERTFRGQMNDF